MYWQLNTCCFVTILLCLQLLALYTAGAVAGSAAHVIYYWVKAQNSSMLCVVLNSLTYSCTHACI